MGLFGESGVVDNEDVGALDGWEWVIVESMIVDVTTSKTALATKRWIICSVERMLRANVFLVKLTFKKTACWNSGAVEFYGGYDMEMFGRVGLVEIPVLIAPDQKVWMDKMIKEGKIAIPPGGTLEKGSLYSMFIRMLLHNAMEEQKRQEALEAGDEDDE